MKIICTVFVLMGLSFVSVVAQESCLNPNRLTSLDASWEKALLESDANHLKSLLLEDFIWVHNHASLIDSKSELIKRVSDRKGDATHTRSRTSKDVKVIIAGATGIVTGFTFVDRGPTPANYHFMRTYVEIDGNCFLIANHTMAIPEKEE